MPVTFNPFMLLGMVTLSLVPLYFVIVIVLPLLVV